MRSSNLFVPTRKQDPADAEIASHKLLVRAGFIRMVARGIYSYLPLAWRSIRKIEQIVREEMNRSGAQEVALPFVQPSELWTESGRWDEYGPELVRFEDRKGADYCLGPTHEEVITSLIRDEISSYKQLPVNLYQIQSKFRDEPRPRFGLMRGREFIMKDAYSFDLGQKEATESYREMFDAYCRIFDRMGFDYKAVEAATGNIGGSQSHEFQVLAETGGDKLVQCDECSYAANVEMAEIAAPVGQVDGDEDLQKVETPGKRTIEEVTSYLEIPPKKCVKTLIYMTEQTPVAVLVRGDHDANELKIQQVINEVLDTSDGPIRLADDDEIERVTSAPVGFAGPIGLDVPVLADYGVESLSDFVVGGNEADAHYTGVNWDRDFDVEAFRDLRRARRGDECAECGQGEYRQLRGIEVGHVFYLGTKYSEAMDASVQDQAGRNRPIVMGCYGIGISRILAAVVEQNHDEDGIVWPRAIAPFTVHLLPLQMDHEGVVETAETLYEQLRDAGIEVLLDDRSMGVGSKFKDADLLGMPVRVVVGARGVDNGQIEIKRRTQSDADMVAVDDAFDHVTGLIDDLD